MDWRAGRSLAGAPRRRRQPWLDPVAGAGRRALDGVGSPAPGLRALRRRRLDGRHRRPRPVPPLVYRRRRARPTASCGPLDRRVDRGGDGDNEPGLDRPARSGGAGRPQAGDGRDPRRLLLFAPAASHHDRARSEDRPGVGRALRPSATPAEGEIATRNRGMAARLTWKPYMYNPRLAHFLPRLTKPTLIRLGGRGR